MGWTGHELGDNKKWRLFTRGGTEGVYLEHADTKEEINIPSSLLRMLVAEDVRMERMSALEDMDSDQLLGLSSGD